MEDNNRVKPNEWLVDSPKEKVIKQNDDCSAYLERYKFELWERRIGRCPETAPKIGLVAHFNLSLVARFNFGLSARFNFGLIA